jgi:hypothetical protein
MSLSLSLGLTLGNPALNKGGGQTFVEYDFTSGLPSIFTLSRSGAARLARASNGKWASFAADAPRLHHDVLGAPLGLLFERSFADKCVLGTNPAAAPTDNTGSFFSTPTGVSRINSGLGFVGTGWEDLITAVLRITNATGSTVNHQIKQTTGNTNKHTLQVLTRDSGAGASLSAIQFTGGSQVNLGAAQTWEILQLEDQTPTSASRLVQIVTRTNRTQDIAWAMMSETRYAPTPVLHPTDNVTLTIGNESASAPLLGIPKWSTSEVALAFEWYHEWPFSVDNEPIFAIAKASSPTTDYLRIVGMADGTMKVEMIIAGVTIFSSTFAAPTRRTVCRAAIRLKSGSFLAAVNGVGGTVDTDAGDWSGLDTVYINRLGAAYSNCIARSVEFSTQALSDSQIVAASAPNEGGYV